ncbi:MAG TPA: LD-carboxypeptidase, partial [Microlunatus sp.]|nr:LD-carboxypeptidase [Microlunatus sp.]
RRRKGTMPQDRIWPTPLQPGSTVAVIAPAGPPRPDRLRRGAELLESWGLRLRYGPNIASVHDRLGYLSAGDKERAEELVAAWTDPDVDAVWSARGGYGVQRMIDLVDFAALRSAGPKHFVGYSDLTALHDRLGRELGQVTIHGPMVAVPAQLDDPETPEALRRLLFSAPAPGTDLLAGDTLFPGTGTGRLIGGNLSLIASSVGVDPAPDRPSILFLEDDHEDGYRVDRMLTQLARGGWLTRVTGVVVGDFTETDDEDQLRHVFADRLGGLGVPVITGAPAGHGARNLALPLGAEVTLRATADGGSLALS